MVPTLRSKSYTLSICKFRRASTLLLLLLLKSSPALAFFGFEGTVPSSIDLGTWSGGTISTTATFCIASASGNNPNGSGSTNALPYQFKLDVASASAFEVEDSNGNTLSFTATFSDVLDNYGPETLNENSYSSFTPDGQFKQCRSGDNIELTIQFDAADFNGAPGGIYSASVDIRGQGGINGNESRTDNFDISVTVNAPNSNVKVSSLDSIAFGTYGSTQTNNLSASEYFCIYSTASNGGYEITISSSNQVGGNFRLSSGSDFIPYTLYFSPAGTGSGTIPVSASSLSGNGSSSVDCFGVNNATLTAEVLSTDIFMASAGTYTDTLTLLVTPQ